jgi:hypothetical protein
LCSMYRTWGRGGPRSRLNDAGSRNRTNCLGGGRMRALAVGCLMLMLKDFLREFCCCWLGGGGVLVRVRCCSLPSASFFLAVTAGVGWLVGGWVGPRTWCVVSGFGIWYLLPGGEGSIHHPPLGGQGFRGEKQRTEADLCARALSSLFLSFFLEVGRDGRQGDGWVVSGLWEPDCGVVWCTWLDTVYCYGAKQRARVGFRSLKACGQPGFRAGIYLEG